MSVETLKQDLQQVIESIPQGPLTSAVDVASYLRNNLVPFIENVVSELAEQDECIGTLVNESEDILHEENGEIFAGLIASSKALVGELRVRVGGDKRVLGLIREYEILAAKAVQILADIVVPDDVDDDDETPPAAESAEVDDAVDGKDGAA